MANQEESGLTEEQIEEIKDVFMLFDQDGNECITVHELGRVMRALGQVLTEKELDEIIAEIDADGNGIIEFPEFVDLMSRRPWGKQGTEEELSNAFQTLDNDGEGHISAAAIRHLLTTMGEKLTDEELDEMMQELPVDGDGMLAYQEMVSRMLDV